MPRHQTGHRPNRNRTGTLTGLLRRDPPPSGRTVPTRSRMGRVEGSQSTIIRYSRRQSLYIIYKWLKYKWFRAVWGNVGGATVPLCGQLTPDQVNSLHRSVGVVGCFWVGWNRMKQLPDGYSHFIACSGKWRVNTELCRWFILRSKLHHLSCGVNMATTRVDTWLLCMTQTQTCHIFYLKFSINVYNPMYKYHMPRSFLLFWSSVAVYQATIYTYIKKIC